MDTSAEVKGGTRVRVSEGTVYGDREFVVTTNDPITLGTTSLVFAVVPAGQELGYAEFTSTKTSTNTTSWINDKISGLSLTIVGTGRPVEIEVFSSAIRSDTADKYVILGLIEDGSATASGTRVFRRANIGEFVSIRRRRVLAAGTSYTFEAGVQVESGVTASVIGGATAPTFLAVTER
jgi:hypothetical protein